MSHKIQLSEIDFSLSSHKYSIKELVDDVFRSKIDKESREHFKNNIGIETVYKCYDLSSGIMDQRDGIIEKYVESAERTLKKTGTSTEDIGMITTINDNYQRIDPAPTVDLVSKLGLNETVRTQNSQGLACSAFGETLNNSYGHFALEKEGDVLILNGSYYTDWFLPTLSRMDNISRKDRKNMGMFAYFLMFSDSVSSVKVSKEKSEIVGDYAIEVDLANLHSRVDVSPEGYRKARAEFVPLDGLANGLFLDMEVNSKELVETTTNLTMKNFQNMRKFTPEIICESEIYNIHTGGKVFIDKIKEKGNFNLEKVSHNYDILRETGNTGSVSSLQLMNDSIRKGLVKKDQYGIMLDFGWEGAKSFPYKVL